MSHGTHNLDHITRLSAIRALDTVRKIVSNRYFNDNDLAIIDDVLLSAERAIAIAPPVVKATKVQRFVSAVTGRFMKKADALADPTTSYATFVQSRGGC